MSGRKLTLLTAFVLAVFAAGCFNSDGKRESAENDAPRSKTKEKTYRNDDRDSIASGDDNGELTPAGSMRRDLSLLKAREGKQAKLIAQMQNELSENESLVAKEEKRLAEIRQQITSYEEALGDGRRVAANNPSPNRHEEILYSGEQRQASEYNQPYRRQTDVNLAQNAAPESRMGPHLPDDDYQAIQNNSGTKTQSQQEKFRQSTDFAGAPRGFARQNLPSSKKPEPEGEIVVWNPNDPSQAVPPGVMMDVPAPESVRPISFAQAEKRNTPLPATATRREPAASEHQANAFGVYTAEVFNPDMYLGKGG